MKAIKIYLTVVTVLLIIAIGLGVYVWYTIQKLNTATTGVVADTPKDTPAPNPGVILEKPIVVDVKDLPETQKKVIETFGYEKDTFTITQDMVTCAEESVGTERLQEILDGAAPSAFESMKLLPCLK